MFVIGTAGHVDHGKSALVRALTGIDPDRLQEEKDRGLTIDLGFAWLKLPSGKQISIVDVPGHERFIKNMLAGVGGIDLALLVIAADEGVMPQTREHLAILDLLQVKSGILVITKKDLVDKEWLELVISDVSDTVKSTTLAKAPSVAVSAITGEGLAELISMVDTFLDTVVQKEDVGRPRLAVDRVFTMTGFGSVVTGTLIDGHFEVGQEVEVVPEGLKSRIRGLQMHKQKVEKVAPGNRVAVNLVGLATTDIKRGNVITTPGWLKPTLACDVKLRIVPELPRPIRHNATVLFYTGSSETAAKLRLLEKEKVIAGETTWAQIHLDSPVALVKGDYFIIRSSTRTVGGGKIVDPYPRRHRRFHEETINHLTAVEAGGPAEMILKLLDRGSAWDIEELVARSGLPLDQVKEALDTLLSKKKALLLGKAIVFSSYGWERFVDKVTQAIEVYHRNYPLRSGMPKEELKSRLQLSAKAFNESLVKLRDENVLVEKGTVLSLPAHRITFSPSEQKLVDVFLHALNQNPYSPVLENIPDSDILNALIEQKKIVKVSDTIVFSMVAYTKMVEIIVNHIKLHGKVTVAEVRNIFNTSRKYALALMEYLDEQRITRRVGDERLLR